MRTKWIVPVLIIIAVIVAIFIIIPREPMVVSEPRIPKGWTFTLPEGDAKAGRSTLNYSPFFLILRKGLQSPLFLYRKSLKIRLVIAAISGLIVAKSLNEESEYG